MRIVKDNYEPKKLRSRLPRDRKTTGPSPKNKGDSSMTGTYMIVRCFVQWSAFWYDHKRKVHFMRASASIPHSTPEQQGISSAAISEFIEAADKTIFNLHSVMLMRHG